MQNCSTCGYQSPEGAKFCRQCGAPLYAESELSGADTRNYGRQEAAPVFSAPLPKPAPSVVDAFGSETARQYKPPVASVGTSNLPPVAPHFVQAPPAYNPVFHSPAQNTAPIKPKRRFLKYALYGFLLFFAGGIGAAINEESNSGRRYISPTDSARLETLRKQDELNRLPVATITERYEKLREELQRNFEDFERAREEAQRAAERGLTRSGEKPLDLSAFDYPGSTSSQSSRIPGAELTTLRTKDNFDTIRAYYVEKLGKPALETNERNQRRALFLSAGQPSVAVLIQESNDRNRDKIFILPTPTSLAKVLATQNKVVAPADTLTPDGKAPIQGVPAPAAPDKPVPVAPVVKQ